jgi:ABC-type multidrug transport system fused ATPase/permease subunit
MSFVVIVAHKIETIAKADWIYVMNKGHVIQEGTYDTLMQDVNGNFYEMVKIQRALP